MSAMSNNPSFDHSYELPLRRNLLLLLDLLGLLRFIAVVLLDRLGVAWCHGDDVHLLPLPGQPWGGEHATDVTLERLLLEAAGLWETGTTTTRSSASITAPRYRRRRRRVTQPAEGDAVCAICLAGLELEESGEFPMVVAELCGCSNAFHAACIDAWVVGSTGEDDAAATCPLCRAPMSMLPTAWNDGHSYIQFVPRSRAPVTEVSVSAP